MFYNTEVKVELLSENQEINEYHFVLQVRFDNRAFKYRMQSALKPSRANPRMSPLSPLYNQAANLFGCPVVGGPLGSSSGNNSPSLWKANSIDSRTDSPICSSLPSRGQSPLTLETSSQISMCSNSESKALSPIPAKTFLNIFPFCIIFDQTMAIKHTGSCLKVSKSNLCFQLQTKLFLSDQIVCPNVVNENMPKVFTLIKPRIDFSWDSVDFFNTKYKH